MADHAFQLLHPRPGRSLFLAVIDLVTSAPSEFHGPFRLCAQPVPGSRPAVGCAVVGDVSDCVCLMLIWRS